MRKLYYITALVSTVGLGACQTTSPSNTSTSDWMGLAQSVLNGSMMQSASVSSLTSSDIIAGLKEALNIGTTQVVSQLGQTGGFNLDPTIRIALPSKLQSIDDTLNKIGLGALTADLKNKMNYAAELATPRAKDLFMNAIQNMTIADAQGILSGPNDAATQYLRKTMGAELVTDIQPIIDQTLMQAGAVQAYDSVMSQYRAIPFVPDLQANLNDYVTEKALDGIFYYVAQEEAAIRQNPAKRTTELLQKVFGTL